VPRAARRILLPLVAAAATVVLLPFAAIEALYHYGLGKGGALSEDPLHCS
jgi:hypothetical protein